MEFTPVQLLALARREAKFSPTLAYMLANDIALDIDEYLSLCYWEAIEYESLDAELQAEVPRCLRPDLDEDFAQELIDDLTEEELISAAAYM